MKHQRSPLLTVKQVYSLLNVSERTVYRLVKKGQLAAPRSVGGAKRWFRSDVRIYLQRLRRGDFEAQERAEAARRKSARTGAKPAKSRQGPQESPKD